MYNNQCLFLVVSRIFTQLERVITTNVLVWCILCLVVPANRIRVISRKDTFTNTTYTTVITIKFVAVISIHTLIHITYPGILPSLKKRFMLYFSIYLCTLTEDGCVLIPLLIKCYTQTILKCNTSPAQVFAFQPSYEYNNKTKRWCRILLLINLNLRVIKVYEDS